MFGGRAPDVAPRLAIHLAPLLEVRQRPRGTNGNTVCCRTCRSNAAQDPSRGFLYVFLRDAAAGPRSLDRVDIDADLARQTSHRW